MSRRKSEAFGTKETVTFINSVPVVNNRSFPTAFVGDRNKKNIAHLRNIPKGHFTCTIITRPNCFDTLDAHQKSHPAR